LFGKPEHVIDCDRCEDFYERDPDPLPCIEYEDGDEFMFYDGKQQPVCYQLTEPPLYSRDNQASISYWNFLSSDRNVGDGPTTIRTESITDFCRSSDLTYEIFLKIKTIESIYYRGSVKKYSDRMEKINKKKPAEINGI